MPQLPPVLSLPEGCAEHHIAALPVLPPAYNWLPVTLFQPGSYAHTATSANMDTWGVATNKQLLEIGCHFVRIVSDFNADNELKHNEQYRSQLWLPVLQTFLNILDPMLLSVRPEWCMHESILL